MIPRHAPPRLDWMDPARAIAVGLVVFYHAKGYANFSSRLQADAGVDAFLLLSGFGLAYASKAESTRRFLARRLWRLLPAYWLVLAAIVITTVLRGGPFEWTQLWLHATCLHLVVGDPYTLGLNDSFWFLGLIVPLYLVYACLRPWVVRDAIGGHRTGTGYAALAMTAAAMVVVGWHLLPLAPTWGTMAAGHAPHRLHALFLGAIAGLIARRREPLGDVVGRPGLLLGLTLAAGAVLVYGWAAPAYFTVAGASAVGAAVVLTRAGDRYRLARPAVVVLTVLGAVAYEVFLCHQFVMRLVGDALVLPWVAQHRPRYSAEARALTATLIGLAASVPVAYALRWAVAFRDARADWRRSLGVACLTTAVLATAGVVVPAAMPSARPRTVRLAVELPIKPPFPRPLVVDPMLTFGSEGAADLVFVERRNDARARVGLRRWGDEPTYGGWVPASELWATPWTVTISEAAVEVTAGGRTVRSPKPPFDWRARVLVGKNAFNFDGVAAEASVPVRRVE